jgi:hypothetical protein
MPLTLKPATGSGQMTLISVAGTTTSDTLTFPAKTGNVITSADSGTVTQTMLASNVAGNGPAFGAYQSSAQTALGSATYTKLVFQTEEFDTNNCFDNVTNYRFTPTVAGYYQINGALQINGSTTTAFCTIYKNGASIKFANYVALTSTSPLSIVSAMLYLNGSSDYVELWGYTGTSLAPLAGQANTWFNGALVRAA